MHPVRWRREPAEQQQNHFLQLTHHHTPENAAIPSAITCTFQTRQMMARCKLRRMNLFRQINQIQLQTHHTQTNREFFWPYFFIHL